MNNLLLTLKLLQPLLVATPAAGEEDSSVSLDYIPGSVIRGALIERFRQRIQGTALLHDELARRLFFSNAVRYLNGYLADNSGLRSLPKPASWFVEKESEAAADATIYDLAILADTDLKEPKSYKNPYCWVEEPANEDENSFTIIGDKPKRYPQLHNASEDRFVKREADSTLFRYEALAAGQRFSAPILCDDATLAQAIQSLLAPQELSLGRSRSAGYGRVMLEQVKPSSAWVEYPSAPNPANNLIILTLLSDTILRHPASGAYTTDLPQALNLQQLPARAFVATAITGGFNRTWGMPLTQSPTLQAGSVWVFKHNPDLLNALANLTKTGIGERCNEGFGRIALNWHCEPELIQGKLTPAIVAPQTLTLHGAGVDLAQAMVNRLYRQQLEDKLLDYSTDGLEIKGKIENAQLSRLRTLVRQAWQEQQPQLVHDFLQALRDTAKNQFRRARLDGKTFLRWLEDGWKEEGLWKSYFYIAPGNLPVLANVTAQDKPALRLEYMARLVDVICKRAIQQEQQAEQKENAA